MDELFVAIAKIEYFDIEGKLSKEAIFLTEIKNFSDAMQKIEKYYGEDLNAVALTLIEGPFAPIKEEYAEKMISGEMMP